MYFKVKEKAYIFQMFEIFYTRIDKATIKGTIHQSIYGP